MSSSKAFLHNYLNNQAPVGYEAQGQRIWLEYLKPYLDDSFVDPYGTAVAIVNPRASYKVAIEAHADEISWYVNYITKEGYIYVIRNGGSDYQIAPSMRAHIHTDKGPLRAVFGWPAIHVRKDKDKPKPDIDTIVLDGGFASDKTAEQAGVQVGSIVTFDQGFEELNKDYWIGRGLDNRMGGFMIAEVVRRLSQAKTQLPFTLYAINAVQEEVGLRGANMIARRLQPDIALITDVTHDTQSPLYSKIRSGDISCGKGPVLSFAPSVQHNVRKMLVQVADRHKIPYQRLASSTCTGTDTDAFAYGHTGIPSALLSLPLKYMHTTVEMIHQKDVTQLIDWIYHFIKALTPNQDFNYGNPIKP